MGLAGILAARLGAHSVLLTDYEPLVGGAAESSMKAAEQALVQLGK